MTNKKNCAQRAARSYRFLSIPFELAQQIEKLARPTESISDVCSRLIRNATLRTDSGGAV